MRTSSEDLEKSLIASLALRGNAHISDAVGIIGDCSQVFTERGRQELYRVIHHLFLSGREVSLMTLMEYLKSINAESETHKALKECIVVNHYPDVKSGSLLLKQYYISRELLSKCTDTAAKILQSDDDALDALSEHLIKVNSLPGLLNINSNASAEQEFDVMMEQHRKMSMGEVPKGVMTGMAVLDRLTGGFQPGELIIVGARPSMGKSAFAGSIMANMLSMDDLDYTPFGCISLEMDVQDIYRRITSCLTDVPYRKIRMGECSEAEEKVLNEVKAKYIKKRAHVIKAPYQANITMIKSMLIDWKRRFGIKILFIDYLGLIKAKPDKSREREVSQMTFELKSMAREFGIPIVLLAQLNRETDRRDDKRPILSDLRESGSIEQDADIVMFLHRPEKYEYDEAKKQALEGKAELIVAKQRNGDLGIINLLFEKHLTRLSDRFNSFNEGICDDGISKLHSRFKDR